MRAGADELTGLGGRIAAARGLGVPHLVASPACLALVLVLDRLAARR